jgi:hypothetical protein
LHHSPKHHDVQEAQMMTGDISTQVGSQPTHQPKFAECHPQFST